MAGAIAVLLAMPRPVAAEHFDIQLTLKTSQGIAEASWDTSPPEGGRNPRQTAAARVGEPLILEWRLRSEFPHGIMKKVRIHLFAARESEVGQSLLPLPDAPR